MVDRDHLGNVLARNKAPANGGRALVCLSSARSLEPIANTRRSFIESPLNPSLINVNARAISPRAVQALSQDLYAGGVLTWEEHVEMSFQADLHPDFTRTIGALTGEKPFPDSPRDFIKIWEHRVAFERRQSRKSPEHDCALHILGILRRIDAHR